MNFRLTILLVATVFVVVGAPFVGMVDLNLGALSDPAGLSPSGLILWHIRLPRVLCAFVAGVGLALGGAAFQALFRNPLATPYTLGVASGAALGVAVATRLGFVAILGGAILLPIAGLIGALLAVAVVWWVSRMRPDFSATVLLLAGVAMTFFFSSVILFLQYTANLGESFRIVRWLMGGLGSTGWSSLFSMAPLVAIGTVVVALLARDLDLLSVGSEIAAGRGVDVARTQRRLFLGTSIMVAGVVAVCGPIGFVGMMAPHISRMIVGGRHHALLPTSALFGGGFLVACDTLARTVVAPVELPVGIITAFLGGPFFLWLLVRKTEGR